MAEMVLAMLTFSIGVLHVPPRASDVNLEVGRSRADIPEAEKTRLWKLSECAQSQVYHYNASILERVPSTAATA